MMNPAEKIAEKFGGQANLARKLGKHRSTICKWAKRTGGYIPAYIVGDIKNAAEELGIELTADDFY